VRQALLIYLAVGFRIIQILESSTPPELERVNKRKLQKQIEILRSKIVSSDNSPSQMASSRRLHDGLPWAFIALSGLATLAWLLGIVWFAVKLFWWLAD
jgi:hypothetical protein